jgi:hypothetical protein
VIPSEGAIALKLDLSNLFHQTVFRLAHAPRRLIAYSPCSESGRDAHEGRYRLSLSSLSNFGGYHSRDFWIIKLLHDRITSSILITNLNKGY